jgi:hypothetical protein
VQLVKFLQTGLKAEMVRKWLTRCGDNKKKLRVKGAEVIENDEALKEKQRT